MTAMTAIREPPPPSDRRDPALPLPCRSGGLAVFGRSGRLHDRNDARPHVRRQVRPCLCNLGEVVVLFHRADECADVRRAVYATRVDSPTSGTRRQLCHLEVGSSSLPDGFDAWRRAGAGRVASFDVDVDVDVDLDVDSDSVSDVDTARSRTTARPRGPSAFVSVGEVERDDILRSPHGIVDAAPEADELLVPPSLLGHE